ncbi:MAG: hypothetical protein V7L29_10185 [Nostoc sp.]|uniref:hypothetical protein n=1 Tax=Nostoc sp. TaxID=1180 RepID=UPI002FF09FEA
MKTRFLVAIFYTQSALKPVISATCSTFIGFLGRLNRRITNHRVRSFTSLQRR